VSRNRLQWLVPGLLLTLGLLLRLWFGLGYAAAPLTGEMPNVAVSFAKTGVLADAYRPGHGPTAHVLPIPAIYGGLIYRWLGVGSFEAELLLSVIATAFVLGSYALFYRAFGMMGTPRPWRLLGLAFLCVAPININLEASDFRLWEGGLGVFLAAGALVMLLEAERAERLGWGRVAAMAVWAGLLFFVSPPLGLAIYLGCLWLCVEKLPWRRWPGAAALAVLGLALFVGPWAVRNQQMLGEPVLLRSNFGMELALANHEAAVSGEDPRAVFRARIETIHPHRSADALVAMQAAGGEVAYARALGDEAKGWIADHPADFARLSLRHLREFLFPPPWLWTVVSDNPGTALLPKVAVNWAMSVFGLLGAALAAWQAPRRYRFALLLLLVPMLPYAVVQPILRYRYIVFALLLFFAVDGLGRLFSAVVQRRALHRGLTPL
jgi:hypothetical protein